MADESKNNSPRSPKTHSSQKTPSTPSGGVDIITPVNMTVKNTPGKQSSYKLKKRKKIFALASAFIVLIILGGWFVMYLAHNPISVPHTLSENKEPEKPLSRVLSEDSPPEDQVTEKSPQDPLLQATADRHFAEFQILKKELDEIGGSYWGGDQYVELSTLSSDADTLFMDDEYESAAIHYQEAINLANLLLARKDMVFAKFLKEGDLSLIQGDGNNARYCFKIALLIDPTHLGAQKGLARANTLESVQSLILSGMTHEKENNLPFALADYQEALTIDPDSEEARKSLDRTKDLIVEMQFEKAISTGLAALQNNDHERARLMLHKAESYRPESQSVKDALAQLDTALRLKRIKKLQEQAVAGEKAEEWQKALKKYMEVLELESNIQFATQGKIRVAEQLRISNHIAFYIEKPQVLENDRHLAEAEMLLDEAREKAQKGPKRMRRLEKLEQLIISAKIPVTLHFTSDGLTDVAIYKVGTFGRFSKKEIALRPGTYTVVGTRNGYKDIRQIITIKPGEKDKQVIISCREKV